MKYMVCFALSLTIQGVWAASDTDACQSQLEFFKSTVKQVIETGEAGRVGSPADLQAQLMLQEQKLATRCSAEQLQSLRLNQQTRLQQTETEAFRSGWLRFYQAEYRCGRRDVATTDFIYCAEQKRQYRELYEWLWQHKFSD